jgi:hypothetical protein
MSRVMTLSGLPMAGAYRPPPGRVLGLGSIGFPAAALRFPAAALHGMYRPRMRGLGVTMTEMCNDPATAIMTTLASGLSAGFAAQTDHGWQQAGTGVAAATTAFNAACTQARAAANAASAAPGDAQAAATLMQIQALTQQQQMMQAQAALQAAQSNQILGLDKPVFYGGLAVLGLLGLAGAYYAFKKR